MSVPALGLPRDRIQRSESDLLVIDTTNGNTFYHGFDRVPGRVDLRVVCITANNGWKVGDEMPIDRLWRDAGDENDGAANVLVRYRIDSIFVKFGTETISFFDPTLAVTNANKATWTRTQWRLKIICSDSFPLA